MAETQKINYQVVMSCDGCSKAIGNLLKKAKDTGVKGVEDYDIDLKDQRVTITTNSDFNRLDVYKMLNISGKVTKNADENGNIVEIPGQAELDRVMKWTGRTS